MGYPIDKNNKRINDYYKMLFLLNESTDDYLFLWDLRKNKFYFAKDFPNSYTVKKDIDFGYSVDSLLNTIFHHDVLYIQRIMANILGGSQDSFDIDFRSLDHFQKKVWINCRGKVLFDEDHDPDIAVGRLSNIVLFNKIDMLTGLMNYNKMLENLKEKITQGKRGHLMILGIDNFKDINQKFGRGYGNTVLKQTADVLENIEEDYIQVYRLDGDHFAVDLEGFNQERTKKFYENVQRGTKNLCMISSGVVSYPLVETSDTSLLVQYAENALDRAKKGGRNRMEFFSSEDYKKYMYRIELQEELKLSVQNGFDGFRIYYQPQMLSKNYSLYGAEALLRFTSHQYGSISPTIFIPILEQTRLIIPVGKWVMKQAFLQCAKWRKINPKFHMSINMSYLQLREKSITDDIFRALKTANIPGEAIAIEVTESMQLQDYDYFNNIFYQWKEKGIKVSIDDFGTGYSSLGYLKSLEVDEVKIDRCFVSKIHTSTYNYKLLNNMIELAHSVQIQVCCEGVESEEECRCLGDLRPELVQGFLFGRPVKRIDFEKNYLDLSQSYDRVAEQFDIASYGTNTCNNIYLPKKMNKEDSYRALLDGMEEVIYIVDVENKQVCYMNLSAKKLTGIYNYEGKKCYQVFFNEQKECELCSYVQLNQKDFISRQRWNPYLNQKAILKEKLIDWEGSKKKLVIARLLNRENKLIDKHVSNELHVTKQIIGLYETVSDEISTKSYIQKVAEYVGKFYQADRTLVFLYHDEMDIWKMVFSYCTEGIMPKEPCYQTVTADKMQPWLDILQERKEFVIDNNENIKESYPLLWKGFSIQNIQNALLSGIWDQDKLIGFICVDNASFYKRDLSLIKKGGDLISQKLVIDIYKKENDDNLIHELIKSKSAEDILSATKLGLWMIQIDQTKNEYSMIADKNMKKALGVSGNISNQDCYKHWYNQINDGFYHYVNNAVETMITTGDTVEVEYTWNHPERGEVTVRCVGALVSNVNGIVVLEGYHRILDDLNQLHLLSRNMDNEIFEFHESRQMIYFHSERRLIYGNERREEKFPDSWIERGIVHPYFIEGFRGLFKHVEKKQNKQSLHVMLKNKMGEYEWYKIETRHMGKEKEDRKTLIVQIVPMMEKKLVELKYNRTNDFYQAMLSETIAYAEINLDDGNILATGGFWENYSEQESKNRISFSSFIREMIGKYVVEEDQERCYEFLQLSSMKDYFESGIRNTSIQYKRKMQDEDIHWIELTIHMFQEKDTRNIYALLYQKDINRDKRRALKNEEAAQLDALTHALNRNTFEKQVNYYMATLEKDKLCALMIIDIDNFKEINDFQGHLQGDAILKNLTETLRTSFRATDLIGRLGGDEFMVFVKDIKSSAMLEKRLDKLYEAFHKADTYSFSCSSGICLIEKENFQYETCLKQADEALYQSKRNGKNSYTFFENKHFTT